MQIKRLKNTRFGTKKISRVVTGWEWVDENEFVWNMDYEEA